MTRDEMIELLGWRLGDRTDMQARISAELNYVQDIELEGAEWLPWFLEKEFAGVVTEVGNPLVAKPIDYLQELEGESLFLELDGARFELEKRDYSGLRGKEPAAGLPEFYAVTEAGFFFYPTPAQVYTLRGLYAAKDARMSQANEETLWLKYASDLVMACVGKQVALKHIQSPEMASGFMQDEQVAKTRLLHKHVAIKEVNRDSYMKKNY